MWWSRLQTSKQAKQRKKKNKQKRTKRNIPRDINRGTNSKKSHKGIFNDENFSINSIIVLPGSAILFWYSSRPSVDAKNISLVCWSLEVAYKANFGNTVFLTVEVKSQYLVNASVCGDKLYKNKKIKKKGQF